MSNSLTCISKIFDIVGSVAIGLWLARIWCRPCWTDFPGLLKNSADHWHPLATHQSRHHPTSPDRKQHVLSPPCPGRCPYSPPSTVAAGEPCNINTGVISRLNEIIIFTLKVLSLWPYISGLTDNAICLELHVYVCADISVRPNKYIILSANLHLVVDIWMPWWHKSKYWDTSNVVLVERLF